MTDHDDLFLWQETIDTLDDRWRETVRVSERDDGITGWRVVVALVLFVLVAPLKVWQWVRGE